MIRISTDRVTDSHFFVPEKLHELAQQIVSQLATQSGFVEAIAPSCQSIRNADTPPNATPGVIFPGSFNPLHRGHQQMAAVAAVRFQQPVWYELSINNADKQMLNAGELANRLEQDFGNAGLIVTNAGRFIEKAQLFPSCVFITGADTIERISQPRFYGSHQECLFAIDQLKDAGCRFLVFGRRVADRDGNNPFRSHDVRIESALRSICEFVDRDTFEVEISSTEIRQREQG